MIEGWINSIEHQIVFQLKIFNTQKSLTCTQWDTFFRSHHVFPYTKFQGRILYLPHLTPCFSMLLWHLIKIVPWENWADSTYLLQISVHFHGKCKDKISLKCNILRLSLPSTHLYIPYFMTRQNIGQKCDTSCYETSQKATLTTTDAMATCFTLFWNFWSSQFQFCH